MADDGVLIYERYDGEPPNAIELFDVGVDPGGYEWQTEALVLRLSDLAMFHYVDGGCSCNGPYEYTRWADLLPVRRGRSLGDVSHEFRVAAQPWLRASREALEAFVILRRNDPAAESIDLLRVAEGVVAP